jgi:hypothetical protein
VQAIAYVGTPGFLDDRCLPSRRYLNIVVRGALEAGLDRSYVDDLQRHPVLEWSPRPPFVPPRGRPRDFTPATLAQHPEFTAIAGAVFDMSAARPRHQLLRRSFGGQDMTLHHLHQLDTSDGTETVAEVAAGRLTAEQRTYLNEYLHEYATEYRYVGRLVSES